MLCKWKSSVYQCHVWFGWQALQIERGPLAEQPKVNTTYSGLNTFTYQAAKIWNSLPSHLKEASSLFDFKQRIWKWPGFCLPMWLLCFMPLIRCLIPIYLRILLFLWMHFIDCWWIVTYFLHVCFICFVSFSPVSYPSIILHSVA